MAPFVINPMSLAQHYRRQFAWRDWGTILAELPSLTQQTILDVGCGVGDVAAALVARGARVVGFDANEELLREARNRGLTNAEFRSADLRTISDLGVAADGLWCSFTAAYFPDLCHAANGMVDASQRTAGGSP